MKKINTNLLLSVLAIIFFFFTFNAYAQEGSDSEGLIDMVKIQKEAIEGYNLASGATEGDEYNSTRSNVVQTGTLAGTAIFMLGGTDMSVYAENVDNAEDVPYALKRGLYGTVEDGVYALYESQPYVNVYAHLASEWVPGYDDAVSVYAETEIGDYDSGYTELVNTGIVGLWTQVRNITYVFFMIIFIVVGFMIMFRSKIGGQTLITLGNSLPNIILALIGVTFSFAIAGLIIDIGGLIMVMLVDIFDKASSYNNLVTLESIGSLFKAFLPGNWWETLSTSGTTGGKSGLFSLFGGGSSFLTVLGLGGTKLAAAAGAASWLSTTATVLSTMGILGLLIILAILGVVTVGIFKVFITLVKAYIGILMNVIIGPIQIAMSAIPGKGASFMNWIKSILRNVLVYPITFAILNAPGVLYSMNEGGLSLPGPDKLTLAQSENQINQSGDFISGFVIVILQILVIFAASNADKYVQAIIPPTTSKAGGDAMAAAKQGMQGIPLIGKLIK
ncbi:MAG: hypothetical protein PHP08_02285 [Candidatus Dojkabacteria bacterium]|nr:hypothetical protein [Candidatus Dojkabacteria bacterium]